ncbi:MAG TPA: SDR family NAD(P)-dependent oxidoreductase [Aeromicrobium sp.]|nr:SDR family NAD(P)-dependent oxidoreductase [Aeromicrobium sp.]HKY57129.1 SDR family NAD(P)-dependent oxidoreductase [Aeromicrobium sp.]
MKDFKDKVAVVTGASSGMGRSLAIQLAEAGAQVAISDVDEVGLKETAVLCEAAGSTPRVDVLDVRDRTAVHAYADAVAAQFGGVNLVINNAGIAMFGTVRESPYEDIEKVMDVDFWGVVHGTKAFLPHLIASGDGHVVNISSVFGLFSFPTQSSYNAAKFAVRGFTEALRQEMLVERHPVKVTCVHPGGIRTNIVNLASASNGADLAGVQEMFARMARTTPESAAATILKGVRRGRPRVLIGADAVFFDTAVRLLGPSYQRIVASASNYFLRTLDKPGSREADKAA